MYPLFLRMRVLFDHCGDILSWRIQNYYRLNVNSIDIQHFM